MGKCKGSPSHFLFLCLTGNNTRAINSGVPSFFGLGRDIKKLTCLQSVSPDTLTHKGDQTTTFDVATTSKEILFLLIPAVSIGMSVRYFCLVVQRVSRCEYLVKTPKRTIFFIHLLRVFQFSFVSFFSPFLSFFFPLFLLRVCCLWRCCCESVALATDRQQVGNRKERTDKKTNET